LAPTPSIGRDLHAGGTALELVLSGYAFSYAAGLITGGRLGDLFGHRKLYLVGMAAFAAASLLCALAQSPAELIAARLVQGVTAAALVPQVLALITAAFPPGERPRALAWFGVTIGAAMVGGQVLGGALLDWNPFHLAWRSVFLINVPVGTATVAAAWRLLPRRTPAQRPRLDLTGAGGLALAIGLLLVPLTVGRTQGWPVWTWVNLAAAVPVLAATLWWERHLVRRGGQPVLDLTLLSEPGFAAGLGINAGFMGAYGGMLFGLTLVLQAGLGLGPLAAGLTFAPLGLAFAVTSVLSRGFIAHHGARITTVGTATASAGLLLLLATLAASGAHTGPARLVPALVVIGVGNGLTMPSLIGSVLAGVRPRHAGAASGVLTTAQQFASAAGVAILGVLFFSVLADDTGPAAYVHALQPILAADVIIMLAACVLSLKLRRPVRS
jgi:MFS family permease